MSETKRPWNAPWRIETFEPSPCKECRCDAPIMITGTAKHAVNGTPIDYIIATMEGSNEACGVNQEANAALIAAAPELYEALVGLLDKYRSFTGYDQSPLMIKAMDALAKANPNQEVK